MTLTDVIARLLINRRYARLWFGGAISVIGDFIFDTTVLLWIAAVIAKGEPWAPAAAGGVLIAAVVPVMLVGPLAGVYVDRWSARRTMLVADAIRAVLIGGLAIMPALPHGALSRPVQLIVVYGVVIACSTVAQFFGPARFTIITDVVPADDQPKASGIAQATTAFAAIVGPPLAAPLLFTTGVQWALVIDAATFLVSFAAVFGVRIAPATAPRPASSGFWAEFGEGVRAFLSSRPLVAIVVMAMIVNFGAGLLTSLDVFFVQVNLHARASLYGLLGTAFGVGSVIGAILAGAFGQRYGPTRVLWQGLIAGGIGVVIFARMTNFAAGLIMFGLLAVPIAALNTVMGPLIRRLAPREKLGRIIAFLVPATQVSTLLALAAGGVLASTALRELNTRIAGVHFGPYDTIFVGAGLLIIAGGLYAMVAVQEPAPAVEPVPEPVGS